ncbi:MAG: hypothetical protein ACREDH_15345 [Methylocella sp.]
MTENGLLEHIFERLSRADSGGEIFGADEAMQWPGGAIEVLIKSGLLERAEPAQVIECDGCERNCFMPVLVRPAEGNRPARAFISCDKPEDVGRVPVEPGRLAQWRITGGMLAGAVARLLRFTNPPHEDTMGKRWTLGLLKGTECKGEVKLSVEGGVTLTIADQSMPLVHVLTLNRRGLKADKDVLLRLVDGDTRQPASGVGSAAWRKQTAKAAANARHSQPGGSRDKQRQIREIWATGKYSSRDLCAEEECAALGMSFSAARKALRNA